MVQPSGPPQKGLLPKLKVGHAVKVLGSGSGGGTPGNCSPLLLLLLPALLQVLPLPPPARLPLPQPRSSACTRLARVWHDVLYQGHGFSPPPPPAPINNTPPPPLQTLTPAYKKAHLREWNIIDGVSGVLLPGRLTLLLGTPGSGRSVLMKALAGRLGREKSLKVGPARLTPACLPSLAAQPAKLHPALDPSPSTTLLSTLFLPWSCRRSPPPPNWMHLSPKAPHPTLPPFHPGCPAGLRRRADLQWQGAGHLCPRAHRGLHLPAGRALRGADCQGDTGFCGPGAGGAQG